MTTSLAGQGNCPAIIGAAIVALDAECHFCCLLVAGVPEPQRCTAIGLRIADAVFVSDFSRRQLARRGQDRRKRPSLCSGSRSRQVMLRR